MANVAIYEIPKPWEGHGWRKDGEPLWYADKMILPQKLIDVLERDATELDESDGETGEQEYAADSNTDSSSDVRVWDMKGMHISRLDCVNKCQRQGVRDFLCYLFLLRLKMLINIFQTLK